MSEGLAQDSYEAAGVGFKPAIFWTQGTEPATEPPLQLCKLTIEALTVKAKSLSQSQCSRSHRKSSFNCFFKLGRVFLT